MRRCRVGVLEDARGRPDGRCSGNAMTLLANGLSSAGYNEHVARERGRVGYEAATRRSADSILTYCGNLAVTYVPSLDGSKNACKCNATCTLDVKLNGEEHGATLDLPQPRPAPYRPKAFKKPGALMRKSVPVARRVLGENCELTIRLRWNYAVAPQGQRRHARRSPRRRDDAGGDGCNFQRVLWKSAPDHARLGAIITAQCTSARSAPR